jgi:hypothetical protein
MYSVDNIESLAFVGAPYLFNEICFIYPLSVGKVLALQDKYSIYLQLLTLDRSSIIRILKSKNIELESGKVPDPFDFLMKSCELDSKFLLELEDAFRTFIQEGITILASIGNIVVGPPEDKRIIDRSNFSDFQNILRLQNKMSQVDKIPEDESEKARYFREKRELRDAIKRKQESAHAPSLTGLMSALCVYGIGITPLNIKDISLFTLYTLLGVSGSKERYESEMEFLYGGADPKKLKPKYWRNNENN